ncbi:MAG: hypothetical protein HUU36_09685 [Candidatus Omnitrophica bacterium]|nr:hypothetical protein [Candidatus Omnitrophota bacterium]
MPATLKNPLECGHDFTLAEIKQLLVRERFSVKTGKPVYPQRYDSATAPAEFRVSTLEEELQLIQGLNRSTGRTAGVYPELKQPRWHRDQGRDLSRVVLPILRRYGYATKADACFLQCFELTEVRRLRHELGWQGRLVLLVGAAAKYRGSSHFFLSGRPATRRLLASSVFPLLLPAGTTANLLFSVHNLFCSGCCRSSCHLGGNLIRVIKPLFRRFVEPKLEHLPPGHARDDIPGHLRHLELLKPLLNVLRLQSPGEPSFNALPEVPVPRGDRAVGAFRSPLGLFTLRLSCPAFIPGFPSYAVRVTAVSFRQGR